LSVFAESRREWTDAETRLLEAIAAESVAALKNAEMYDSARRRIWELSKGAGDRQRSIVPALHKLAAAVDARDPRSAGHSERVMEYALVIARELDYAHGDDAAWQRLRDGCLMLDIGKIAVPDAVLAKREQLSIAELDIIRNHTVFGYELLNSLQMFTDELVIVRSHHERFDGAGYPDGTKGDELPLLAYIVGAADAIDAMVSERPHRRSMSIEVALAEIEAGAGTQFHPDVATALLDSAVRGTLKVIRPRPVALEEAS
jgi:HD-GYP domain-containing protein (c-di-GMP phosphodiesterase class II)